MQRFSLLVVVLLATFVCGCQTNTFGGARSPVVVGATKPGAVLYVVTLDKWLEHDGEEQVKRINDSTGGSSTERESARKTLLDPFAKDRVTQERRIDNGREVVDMNLPLYAYVLVAELDGHITTLRFHPQNDATAIVQI